LVAGVLIKTMEYLLPQANPDFERAYRDEVVNWWLEIDDKNVVHREIALNAAGEPVAAAPLGENYGIFTDLDSAPDGLGPEIQASQFEGTWQRFSEKWRQAKWAKPIS
jgi:hypothetical protein